MPTISNETMAALTVALFMAVVANRLVEGLIVPLYDHFKWDRFSLLYVGWVAGGVLVFISGVNFFVDYIPNPLIGTILSALVAGGGSNMLADLFNRSPAAVPPADSK